MLRVDDSKAQEPISCGSCSYSFAAEATATTPARVTLTKSQLKLPEVEEFVVLLVNIASDGSLSHEDLQKLTDWLNAHAKLEVPAVRFMVDLMIRICADGKLTDEEIFEVQLGIERVLPKEFRTKVAETRKSAYYNQPASEDQLDTIENIIHRRPEGLSRRQASEMLDELFKNPPTSNRQIMFLRFWNRMDLATKSRREISEWMDSFIKADRARWLAWDLFEEGCDDDGSHRDPSFVPVGAAGKYLRKVYSEFGN